MSAAGGLTLNFSRSQAAFNRARQLLPGGVNSPVRSFKAVNMNPVFIKKAAGAILTDVDDNQYIDYVGSFGPLILGHACEPVVEAVKEAAVNGTSYGACCELELQLAEMICAAIPSVEMIRMVNSGTEATMSAIRLARAYTGKEKIIKFAGCYHGHGDSFLIKAGSGMLTGGIPNSAGVLRSTAENTIVCNYNDWDSVQKAFEQNPDKIAAVIVEPVAANMGLVLPEKGFLQFLRDITTHNHSLLIFDEVITGFRLSYGGYQDMVQIKPDLTTLGKIIGGGLPVGAYGGRQEIMQRIAPEGDVYQAGTLSGNPLAMAAGVATLKELQDNLIYLRLDECSQNLCCRLDELLTSHKIPHYINRLGSIFTVFFTQGPVHNYEDVLKCNTDTYARFFRLLLEQGVYFPPAQFEVAFISRAHQPEVIDKTIRAAAIAIENL